jgi:hypothetical protein
LQGEHIGKIVKLLFESDLEQTGVAGSRKPGKKVLGVVSEKNMVSE